MKEGMFIVFEGIDGAGTTTQSKMLAEWFATEGIAAHLTWEPSTGKAGTIIREYLAGTVDVPDVDRHYHALALLFAADRLDHLARAVEPRLCEGVHVVCDRYLLSSLVYQSLHCAPSWVAAINDEARKPDVTLLLDLPVEAAMERLARRSLFTPSEIYETEDQQEKLRDKYLKAASDLYAEHEIIVIDAAPGQDEVHERVLTQLGPKLKAFTGKDEG